MPRLRRRAPATALRSDQRDATAPLCRQDGKKGNMIEIQMKLQVDDPMDAPARLQFPTREYLIPSCATRETFARIVGECICSQLESAKQKQTRAEYERHADAMKKIEEKRRGTDR